MHGLGELTNNSFFSSNCYATVSQWFLRELRRESRLGTNFCGCPYPNLGVAMGQLSKEYGHIYSPRLRTIRLLLLVRMCRMFPNTMEDAAGLTLWELTYVAYKICGTGRSGFSLFVEPCLLSWLSPPPLSMLFWLYGRWRSWLIYWFLMQNWRLILLVPSLCLCLGTSSIFLLTDLHRHTQLGERNITVSILLSKNDDQYFTEACR